MQIRATVVGLVSCVLLLCGEVTAQTTSGKVGDQTIPGDITFEVPVHLTRLSSYVSKVAVTCMIERGVVPDPDPNHPEKNYSRAVKAHPNMGTTSASREALFNTVELPVSAGQVVTTAHVVVTVPSTPPFKPGESMMYECALTASSSENGVGGGWKPFSPKEKGTSLNVSPTPLPIWGTFVW